VGAVVLYDPDRDVLVLVEQFRMGAFTARQSPWLAEDEGPWIVEPVAGIIDPGETPEEVVHREALEEAGCSISDLVFACKYLASPGGSSETVHVYCGRVDSRGAGGIHGLDHEHEDIRVIAVPADEALGWLGAGRLLSSIAIIGLQWFQLHRETLRKRWAATGDA
jgi:ADP-ribose pyrophosphatase